MHMRSATARHPCESARADIACARLIIRDCSSFVQRVNKSRRLNCTELTVRMRWHRGHTQPCVGQRDGACCSRREAEFSQVDGGKKRSMSHLGHVRFAQEMG